MAVIHQFPRLHPMRQRVSGGFPMPDGSRARFSGPDVADVVRQWREAKLEYWLMIYAG